MQSLIFIRRFSLLAILGKPAIVQVDFTVNTVARFNDFYTINYKFNTILKVRLLLKFKKKIMNSTINCIQEESSNY